MKIVILWYFDKAEQVYPNWRDGHRAAFEELAKKHEVDFILGKKLPDYTPDFLLFWDDSNSEVFKHLDKYNCRKGICLTTDPWNMDNLRKLDVVFVESDPIYEKVRREGIRTIKAFGTDTDFFSPANITKDIEYFYPATFSPWKRQSQIAHLGNKLLCVGTVQPDGVDELKACEENGVNVEIGYFPVEKIRDYYRRTKNVIIPAVHGSERTVLEAMSCNIFPQVLNHENIRTNSYIEEYIGEKGVRGKDVFSPRDFVLKNYSHHKFAQQLLKGIEIA